MKPALLTLTALSFILISCSVAKIAKHYLRADSGQGRLNGQVFKSSSTTYRIGALSERWVKVPIEEGDLAFINEWEGSTINVNSTCQAELEYSLDILSDSLVIGIKEKEFIDREQTVLDGAAAVKTVLTGKILDKEYGFETIVLKKKGCVYDFSYSSPIEGFQKGKEEFDEFLKGFSIIEIK